MKRNESGPKSKDLIQRFSVWRKTFKCPLRVIAAEVGVNDGYLSQIEHGKIKNFNYDLGLALENFLEKHKNGYHVEKQEAQS